MELKLAEIAQNPEWKQMLIDVVQKQDMNPWDIDVSLLVTEYVKQVRKMRTLNLRVPANAVLAASVLLRYKSDSWAIKNNEEETPIVYIPDEIYAEPSIPELEPVIRSTSRRVTLEELINAVEDVMRKEKTKASRNRARQPQPIPDALIELVEDKGDFKTLVEKVYKRVKKYADKENLALFSSLLKEKTTNEVIENMIPLLHLANDRRLNLWQEKIFGEIFIQIPKSEKT